MRRHSPARYAALLLATAGVTAATPAGAQRDAQRDARRDSAAAVGADTVTVRLIDVDVRAAVEALARYLDRPVAFGAVGGGKITLQTPRPIRREAVLPLLRSALESLNLELFSDSAAYRIRPKPAEQPPPAPPPPDVAAARAAGPVQLYVIKLTHARAVDVAATVSALYGRASAFGELGARGVGPTLSQELAQN